MLVRVRKDDRVRILSGKHVGQAATVVTDPDRQGILSLRVDGSEGVLIRHMSYVMPLPIRTSAVRTHIKRAKVAMYEAEKLNKQIESAHRNGEPVETVLEYISERDQELNHAHMLLNLAQIELEGEGK